MMEERFKAFMTDLKPVIEKHYPNTDIEWEDYNEEDSVKWRVTKLYLDMENNYE
jgi:hypothetical protein